MVYRFWLIFVENFEKMSVAEIKNDLILQILQTEDESVLEIMGVLFRRLNEGKDWWAELTPNQKSFVERSAIQSEQGKTVPHATVQAEIKQLLKTLQANHAQHSLD